MDNSLLAVRDINHKYIVVEKEYLEPDSKIKKIVKVCMTIIGALIILFGLFMMSISIVVALGIIILGLFLIPWIRERVVSVKFIRQKKTIVYIVWILLAVILMILGIYNFEEEPIVNENNVNNIQQKEEKIETVSVEELMNNADKYMGKKVRAVGYTIPEGTPTSQEDDIYHYIVSENLQSSIEVRTLKGNIPYGCEITLVGKVNGDNEFPYIDVEKYKINENKTCQNPYEFCDTYEGMTFDDRLQACSRFNDMNWPQFYKYTESYDDGQIYYIVGKVIYTDENGDGLIQLVEGDNRTIVQYFLNESDYIYEGNIIALYGTVSSGGSYTNSNTGEVVSCPLVAVEEYHDAEEQIDLLSDEEQDFIYDTYVNIDGYYDDFPGKSFKFTKNEFAGYSYTVKSIKYTCGTVLISSYNTCANSMSISMSIEVEKGGEIIPVLLLFGLDGDVSCNVMSEATGSRDYERQ